MKNILSLTTTFLVSALFGQGINFDTESFEKLLVKAKKEDKLIFLDAYTTWCGPCKMMDKNIFSLENVGTYYNANFINAKIDMEKGEGLEIAKKYNIKAFPTYTFINGDGKEIYRGIGYIQEDDFIKLGKDALDPSKNLLSLKKQFEEGNREPKLLLNLAKLTQLSDPKFSEQVTEIYFEKYPNKEIGREEAMLLLYSISSLESPILKIAEARKKEVETIMGKDAINETIKYLKINVARKSAYDKETSSYDYVKLKKEILNFMDEKEAQDYIKNIRKYEVTKSAYNKETSSYDYVKLKKELLTFIDEKEAQNQINETKLESYLDENNYEEYEKFALELYRDYKNYKDLDTYELNSISWKFFEHVSNENSLNKAIEWAKLSVEKEEHYDNTDTLANLYNKIGDKENAKIWAEKSISIAKKTGRDYTSTQKLLDSL